MKPDKKTALFYVTLLLIFGIFVLPAIAGGTDDPGVMIRSNIHSVFSMLKKGLYNIDIINVYWSRGVYKTEQEIGKKIHEKILKKYVVSDTAAVDRMFTIWDRLGKNVRRKNVEYEFHIIRMRSVNAFVIPGGYVYVSKKLYDMIENDDELALIIGHEISHVEFYNTTRFIQSQKKLAGIILVDEGIDKLAGLLHKILYMTYDKNDETACDVNGLFLCAKAGYDLKKSIKIYEKFAKLYRPLYKQEHRSLNPVSILTDEIDDVLETHPLMELRKEKLEILIKNIQKEALPGETSFYILFILILIAFSGLYYLEFVKINSLEAGASGRK